MRHPADALSKIGPAGCEYTGTLMSEDTLLAGAGQRAIAGMALGHIVRPGNDGHLLEVVGQRRIAVRRRRALQSIACSRSADGDGPIAIRAAGVSQSG